jgi:hypothetical protein
MTCRLAPKFTTNVVTYFGSYDFVNVTAFSAVPAVPKSNTSLIRDITAKLVLSVHEGQSEIGNSFMDVIQGLLLSTSAAGAEQPANVIMSSMFRGMFELSGIATNGYWSSRLFTNATARELFNSPYARHVNGTLLYDVYVWQGEAKAMVGLMPFTIIAVISLLLLLRSRGGSGVRFDPSGKHFTPAQKIICS